MPIGRLGICLAVGCAALSGWAALPPMSGDDLAAHVRKGHPRLFFTSETWPDLAARTRASAEGRAALERLVRRTENYPSDPVCDHYGPVTTPPSQPIVNVRDWGREAAECALAWRFTGDRALLAKAARMLTVSAAAYHAAIANRRAVHWYSTGRILALSAYDWIFEGLDAETRRALAVSLAAHVEEVQPRPGQPHITRRNSGGVDSGFYSVQSLLWYSGLAFANDGFCDDLAKSHLARGYETFRRLFAFRAEFAGDDGALAHGTPDYSMGAYPWAHFNFMHTCLSAFGRNVAGDCLSLAYFPNWVWWNRIPRKEAPGRPFEFGFGDGQHQDNLLSVDCLFEHMTQYAYFWQDAAPDAARLAATLAETAPNRTLGATWPMYPFLFAGMRLPRPFTPDELAARRIGARHFPDVGQVFIRSGTSPDDTYALYTAGARTQMHKHCDEGNFVIYRKGFLALDSGTRARETDTSLRYYFAQTVAHNCVLVHKPNEPMPVHWGLASDEPAARTNDGGQYLKAAKTLAFETHGDFTYVASDQAASYGPKCRAAVRQFVFLPPETFVVYDRVDAEDAAYAKEWLLHTQNEPTLDGPTMTATLGEGRIVCETLLPQGARLTKIGGEGREFWSNGKNWPIDPAFAKSAAESARRSGLGPFWGNWRLSVAPTAAAKDERFLHVIGVGATRAAATLKRTAKADVAQLQLGDGRAVSIAFHRKGAVGGAIRFGESAPRALTTEVQPQAGICGF